jgi:hypothetical protein
MAVRVDFNTGTTLVPVWEDITSFVKSVSVSRGKDELLDGFSAGSASIELDNRDRRFDPLFASSPYVGKIVPRRAVRVFANYGTATEVRTNLVLNPEPGYANADFQPYNWYTNLGTAELPDDRLIASPSYSKYVSIANPDRPYTSAFVDFAATAGSIHAVSAEPQSWSGTAVDFDYVVNLRWFTAGSVATGVVTTTSQGVANNKFTPPSRFSVYGVAPVDASYGQIEFTTNPVWTTPTADQVPPTVRKVVVEVGSQLSSFYSGDTTDTATAVYAWAGSAGSSVSTGTFQVEAGYGFTGFIDDWDLSYELGGNNTATMKVSDGFSLLANQAVEDQTMPIEQTGLRVARLLSEPGINYPGPQRNIQPGVKFLGNDVTDAANALSYMQEIESSELGQLFVAKDGDLTFLDASQNNPNPDDSVQTFADDDTGIPFTTLEVAYGTEQLTNVLTVTYPGGTETAVNQDSVDDYGVTSLSVDTLNQNNTDAAYLADYYTTRFGQPQYRVDTITVNVLSLSDANQTAVLGLDLGDVVTVKFTPGNVSPQIVQYAKVVRIDSTISDGAKRFEVEFGLETFQVFPMILDDAEYGKLNDDYVLGF